MANDFLAMSIIILLFGDDTLANLQLSRLKLVNNGYQNLTVVIDEDFSVTEGPDVINRTKVGRIKQHYLKLRNEQTHTRR